MRTIILFLFLLQCVLILAVLGGLEEVFAPDPPDQANPLGTMLMAFFGFSGGIQLLLAWKLRRQQDHSTRPPWLDD